MMWGSAGLDSASAFYVMSMVRRLCQQGRTIAAVIHQPSSEVFEMFDQLCLLTDGRFAPVPKNSRFCY